MNLSSKDRKVWVMSPSETYFTPDYIEPVGGIIIPAPGTYYNNTRLSQRFVDYVRIHFFEALAHLYVIDKWRSQLHISCGSYENKAICNYTQMKPVSIIPGDLYLCMDCQYEFWREYNGKEK
jgi:hypothetical protein